MKSFRSEEKLRVPDFETKEMQYLYNEGSDYFFMDNETYEQVALEEKMIDQPKFIKEGAEIEILFDASTILSNINKS